MAIEEPRQTLMAKTLKIYGPRRDEYGWVFLLISNMKTSAWPFNAYFIFRAWLSIINCYEFHSSTFCHTADEAWLQAQRIIST